MGKSNEERQKNWEEFQNKRNNYINLAQEGGFTKEQAEFLFNQFVRIKGMLGIKIDEI